jgi:hypothetical protein
MSWKALYKLNVTRVNILVTNWIAQKPETYGYLSLQGLVAAVQPSNAHLDMTD